MRCAFLLALALAGKPARDGGAVEGMVTVHRGSAAGDASGVVLYVVGFDEPPSSDTAEMRQQGKRFIPDLLPVTAGQTVAFPNADAFLHNVFSLSPIRTFDLGQYGKGESKSKRFPQVGVVDVYCNIHPEMAATILVLPNRRFTRAAPGGHFRIDGVPAGEWTLYAFSRHMASPLSRPIKVEHDKTTRLAISVDESRFEFPHLNKYGEKYREPTKYR